MEKKLAGDVGRLVRSTKGRPGGVEVPVLSRKPERGAPVKAGQLIAKRRRTNAPEVAVIDVVMAPDLQYDPKEGVSHFVLRVREAAPMVLVGIERRGVRGQLVKDMASEMGISTDRLYKVIGVPKSTVSRSTAADRVIRGAGGQAALGMVRLLGIAQSIVDNSDAVEAADFDAAHWLGKWIERPQPALGGRKPAELLDTPTGVDLVARVLGALESGAYL